MITMIKSLIDGHYLKNKTFVVICYCCYYTHRVLLQRVKLHFVSFDVEAGSNDCSKDTVNIYDGYDTSARLFGSFCGDRRPDNITASRNSLLLSFSSDAQTTSYGFWIKYSANIEGIIKPRSRLIFDNIILRSSS